MMKKIKMTRATIDQSDIAKLDIKEKKRFIMFTNMIRDLELLQKFLIYTTNDKQREEPFFSAKNTLLFFFQKTLISKLHEMWFFLNKNNILSDYPKFSADLKAKISGIKTFFSEEKSERIFSFIRNKFGFHYEYWDDIDSPIDNALKYFKKYEAWLSSENSGNQIFATSNNVILMVIFAEMKRLGYIGDEKQLMDTLTDLTLECARLFQNFSILYIAEAFSLKWELHEDFELEVPSCFEIDLPLIVAK